MTSHEWQPSVFLNGDIAEKITKIKQQEAGSARLWKRKSCADAHEA
jgi:hypothetical protein